MTKYKGYSYPTILQNKLCWYLWKKFQCKKGNHLWDEVYTVERHYLYCDACGEELSLLRRIDDRIKFS